MAFLEVIKSKYRKAVSFRHGASQQDIVTSTKWLDCCEEEYAMEEYSEYSLYNGNPLEFGYFLDSIYIKGIKTQKKLFIYY